MARAKRHYIPGQSWHLTHRCHKREFLLKFSKDRRRWLQWLYEARKRYNLTISTCLAISVNGTHTFPPTRLPNVPEALNLWARTIPIYYTPQGGFATLKVLTKGVMHL